MSIVAASVGIAFGRALGPALGRGGPALFARRLSLPAHKVLDMPALSPTMTMGNISSWTKKVGDAVSSGERIGEVETDKATVDFESIDDGFVAKILVPEGAQDIPVGTPVLIMVEEAADVAAFKDYVAAAPTPAAAAAAPAVPPPPPAAAVPVAANVAPAPAAAAAAAPVITGDGRRAPGTIVSVAGKIYFNEAQGFYRF
ncbi:single hybrid motif-containing protein [Pavlovales sp. CCMP2436]|nr:single hybrid motif-containing protein [Pavlovales sp. CCMP2436]|mmetsp:Transcript_6714/g.17522  ORF Transcript_6714/g.17522 Transcript_6714/m.17522 type:complete len:200 (+) Transcript_6714:36-635(+)|eukprot:CAMPEP_0179886192 /NCGR_PEP_ID=MMETSP0982-20121206/30706_1 /TAXON_ID=483367 /ORGANISM="non described non described, Strain CCMP 2436" /LENGTH=199 /DNA_ID=CAMNT_0021781869 /DNA_START=21 /DNA_END=620 /DNA_ORIENTATION=-